MDEKNLEIIKSIMTHIHIILKGEREKNFTFKSVEELYDKISMSFESLQEDQSSYYGTELLESFNISIEWMKKRGVIIFENNRRMDKSQAIRIDKEKLIKCIIDPKGMKVDSHNRN